MRILALDTTGAQCAVALADTGGAVLASAAQSLDRGHAEAVLPLIENIMAEAGCTYGALDRLLVTTGPGAFTGVRVGVSVARGLALAHGATVVGVSTFVATAFGLRAALAAGDVVHVVLKGRGGQAFYQGFRGLDSDGVPAAHGAALNADIDDIAAVIAASKGHVTGTAMPEFDGTYRLPDMGDLACHYPLPASEGAPAEPFYLRPPDAAPARPALPHRD